MIGARAVARLLVWGVLGLPVPASAAPTCQVVGPVSQLEWPIGLELGGVPVGGLSSLAWERAPGRLLALSDDRGQIAPPRWLELEASLPGPAGGELAVTARSAVTLRRAGKPFPTNAADPEAIALDGERVWIASEGFRLEGVAPFIGLFDRRGSLVFELPLPAHVLPGEDPPRGARTNLAFEGLALSPDGGTLYAALEAALLQDGPTPDFEVPSPTRILIFDLARRVLAREALYWTASLPHRPLLPGGTHLGGLVELAWLAPDRLLALERDFALGAGFTLRLYEVDLGAAENLATRPDVAALRDPTAIRAAAKELVFDFSSVAGRPRNLEGMALGAPGPDGSRPLLVVGDNNFSELEPAAQFFLLHLRCPAGAATP